MRKAINAVPVLDGRLPLAVAAVKMRRLDRQPRFRAGTTTLAYISALTLLIMTTWIGARHFERLLTEYTDARLIRSPADPMSVERDASRGVQGLQFGRIPPQGVEARRRVLLASHNRLSWYYPNVDVLTVIHEGEVGGFGCYLNLCNGFFASRCS